MNRWPYGMILSSRGPLRRSSTAMQGRSGAGEGDAVFLAQCDDKEECGRLFVVSSFDGHQYKLRYRGHIKKASENRGDNNENNDDDDCGDDVMIVGLDTEKGDRNVTDENKTYKEGKAKWKNAPLPSCIICLDAHADSVSWSCRCTTPQACRACLSQCTLCPGCRRPVRDDGHIKFISAVQSLETPSDQGRHTVFAKTMTGKTRTLHVKRTWTVRTVKALLCHFEEHLTIGAVRMIFAGRLMLDGQTVDELNIQDCSTLHLVLRVQGD